MQTWEEMLITKIITQAVEDARYSGTSEFDLGHKVESISWIVNSDSQFKYYCKLLNIEPSYIQNKIKRCVETRITNQQKTILKPIVEKLLKSKKYEKNWFKLNVDESIQLTQQEVKQ